MKATVSARPPAHPASEDPLAQWKGGLLSEAGHELRNRLTGLGYAAEAARAELEGNAPSRTLHFLTLLQTGIDRAHQQLSDLMAAQRAINSGLKFHPEAIGLQNLADRTVSRIQDTRQRERVKVRVDGVGMVTADADLMVLMAGHLLANGLRFSDGAEPVEIHWRSSGHRLVVEVGDRGCGIPAADLPGLFQPFRRAGNAGSRAGLGLGLFLARTAAEAHGGSVTLLPRPGGGTLGRVVLPQ